MPISPSKRAHWGLDTKGDIAVAEHLIAAARTPGSKIGMRTVEALLTHHGQVLQPQFRSGRLSPDDGFRQLQEFARQQAPASECAALDRWFADVTQHMETHGAPPAAPRPDPQAVEAELTEIRTVMRDDHGRYWSDAALQDRHYELIALQQPEQGAEGGAPQVGGTDAA